MSVKTKIDLVHPTPEEDEAINRGIAEDPDTWEITEDEWKLARPASEVFAEMGLALPKKRGRPRKKEPKRQVTLRLDADLLEDLRGLGKGWQTKVNAALREWMAQQKKASE
ncbi:BrnA antitoxin family protein [Thermopetrobacter sp. TC1]|uniref:BrnA antitoxin family protein n=1 Tax=Thermopetrobacter sp. TC1 TaxID=1495045 RepID=UPI0005711037|nr:BrnA antitoxin family protein [Thermopetrobacter sp. TC1]